MNSKAMKVTLWWPLIAVAAPLSLAAQDGAFTLKGRLLQRKGTDTVYMSYVRDGEIMKDTMPVKDGVFEYKGMIGEPAFTYMSIKGQPLPATGGMRDVTSFYLHQGTILIEGKDSLATAILKGSPLNADYQLLNSQVKPLLNRVVALRQQAMATPVAARNEPSFLALEKEYAQLNDSISKVKAAFVQKHPKSYMSLEVVKGLSGAAIDYKKIAPLYNALDVSVRNTPLGKELFKKLEVARMTRTGEVLPAFTALDTARVPLELAAVLKAGKVTLVDFWASWCKPCRAENPNVVKAFTAFHEKGFNIVSVSLDDNADSWKAAILKDGMPWYHVSGLQKWKEPVALLYGIEAVPDNFLLDANGKVIARGLRGEALYKKIEETLNRRQQ